MYLFFDTETTGLPNNWNAPISDTRNWPRMVQLAWLRYDSAGQLLESGNHIIRPEGFQIPQAATRLHGISTERALAEGENLQEVLQNFARQLESCTHLVAHNLSFDQKIIGAEFFRLGIHSRLTKLKGICTMKTGADYCRIPSSRGYKWPTLTELYFKVFQTPLQEAHNASVDIQATAHCFWELKGKGFRWDVRV